MPLCRAVEFVANKTDHEFHEFHENDHCHLDVIGLKRKTRIHSVVLPKSQRSPAATQKPHRRDEEAAEKDLANDQ